jgi:hypothetical protein
MHPVYGLIEIEGVPSQLVWDEVDLLPRLILGVGIERLRFARLEVAVSAGG